MWGLRHEKSIKRVLVNGWKLRGFRSVTAHDCQMTEAGWFDAGQDLIGIGCDNVIDPSRISAPAGRLSTAFLPCRQKRASANPS
jgi:hypothetical protein